MAILELYAPIWLTPTVYRRRSAQNLGPCGRGRTFSTVTRCFVCGQNAKILLFRGRRACGSRAQTSPVQGRAEIREHPPPSCSTSTRAERPTATSRHCSSVNLAGSTCSAPQPTDIMPVRNISLPAGQITPASSSVSRPVYQHPVKVCRINVAVRVSQRRPFDAAIRAF